MYCNFVEKMEVQCGDVTCLAQLGESRHPVEQEHGDPGSREPSWAVLVFCKSPICSLQHGRGLLTQ